ncbi:Mucin-6 [Holothuria leucospilota]|uniref:Mucin-6 n=1 Tax=Holothuria leucospilota TaxID=206669 RepID=A0A9Q1BTH8_HOLLE|nr:Mucin-6 [Holothuria leucospilota]
MCTSQVLSTDFGLIVTWNNRNGATIKLDKSTYFNNTAGLCGTCNNMEYDDFTLKSGVVSTSSRDFASSWKTGLDICFDPNEVFICPADKEAGINARNLCHAINDPLGALSVCHELVDPTFFYLACVYDEGENQVNEDCTEVCRCINQIVECVPMRCSQFASCELLAGQRRCVCVTGYEGDGINCQQGEKKIFRISGCACTVWGDSHLITFDGVSVTTQGDCEYILATDTGNSSIPPYRIIVNNVKDYPSSVVAFARSLRLERFHSFPQVMETSFHLALIFESPFTVRIKVSKEHIDRTIGLCGTCNGNAEDDLQIATGELSVSYLKYLRLEYETDQYEIYVHGRVHVNGIRVNMPFIDGAVQIRETSYGYTATSLEEFGAVFRNSDECDTEGLSENPCISNSTEKTVADDVCHLMLRYPGTL